MRATQPTVMTNLVQIGRLHAVTSPHPTGRWGAVAQRTGGVGVVVVVVEHRHDSDYDYDNDNDKDNDNDNDNDGLGISAPMR